MRYLLPFLFIALAAVPVSAQFPSKKERAKPYVHFDFDTNVEGMVKDRLKLERDLEPFKELVKQILDNPDKFKFDPEKLKGAKLNDPAMKDAVKKWLAQDPELKQKVQHWLDQQPAKQKTTELKEVQKLVEEGPAETPTKPTEEPRVPVPPPEPARDLVAKATQRVMNKAENSELGNWLKESPAWQRAFEDLRTSMQNSDGGGIDIGSWQKKLGIDEQKAWQFGADTLKRLQNMPRPNFERVNLRRSLPNIPLPNLGPPAAPSYAMPSLPSIGAWAASLLILVLTLLFGWQMMRWTRRTAPTADERATLGPWPIQPSAVSTRAELVQAFDYLALLTLGMRVTSWNHQAVARGWSERLPALAPLAHTLAALYEASRYTDGSDELATPQRDQARHALTQLAEALR